MPSPLPALIIIDMQQAMARIEGNPPRNNPQAESNIDQLLKAWRSAGALIVHVRHMSRDPKSPFWPGQGGAEFQPDLAPRDNEHVVEKNVPDAFAQSGLERWLHQRDVKELVITGVSTNNSVEATARSAGNLGFKTRVVADACFAFDKADHAGTNRTAAEVHAMSLANLAGEYAEIIETAALLPLTGPKRPTVFAQAGITTIGDDRF